MELFLWRHAEAEMLNVAAARDADVPALARGLMAADLMRPLTPQGQQQARRMADWLQRQLPAGTRVMASPALRCQQTAAALGVAVETVAALAPDGTIDGLLHAVGWPASAHPVLVVGHQPTIGMVCAGLLAGRPLPWSVRKGAVWWLRARQRDGRLQVVLQGMTTPDSL